ncbi:hypothetical protein EV10_0523 [Prochlorococcus marinus str. SS51]|nr:hypothetical protein EV04_0586 [Prochlorococcus marinus str. LG]KGG20731.1 hypothetical protein EV08_0935 [Prochlorococcus marinus str. SS2]KGG25132.1 hypothetical protein EV09_0026 [Prochlorococcus marinus str. SS35]KGG33316.1 hypothetical protein EV10_0523 [Prochlorococcus marinus str. SS51]
MYPAGPDPIITRFSIDKIFSIELMHEYIKCLSVFILFIQLFKI